MNRFEQLKFTMHNEALSSHYGGSLKKMKFEDSVIYEKDGIISNSPSHKIGFISRFNITGDEHHVVILEGEYYSRV